MRRKTKEDAEENSSLQFETRTISLQWVAPTV